MATVRELADDFNAKWLAVHPFDASYMGIPGFEDRVPDASETGDQSWRSTVEEILLAALRFQADKLSDADAVTLGCLIDLGQQELAELDSAPGEHVVTAMPFSGPAQLLAVAARTILPGPGSASDYLARLRSSGTLIDQQSDRLRAGAAKGRLPVAPLVEEAIVWGQSVLDAPAPEAVMAPQPPAGWDGEGKWQQDREALATQVVKPALGRWVQLLRELLPLALPAARAGLCHLPGGEADYQLAIRTHTTLPLTAGQLHQTGLEEIERLERRAIELGGPLGLRDLASVHDALRASAGTVPPAEAMEEARRSVRRSERRLGEVVPPPLPPPCEVSPMARVVAASGMAPHYTPPHLDGSRPGTYWFNTEVPTGGTGWDLESVAFHEAVPGHHLQFSRIQETAGLTEMQRQRYVTVFSEGWGLYAEQLAEEIGLYSGTEAVLGSTTAALMRAARLVIDTGLHAFGWSRDQAVEFFVAHVPMPPQFLAAEVDRYIAWPGQALAYLTGKLEILRARDEAQRRLGSRFVLPEFH
ncbi:MAG TPA: DUF885 domain-containing protein, partial [Acidimicrobiales bacterium]|nr:DUF885 domain-containing protein [Acidimicrobiales bacterium]